jgi:hypothetical protein
MNGPDTGPKIKEPGQSSKPAPDPQPKGPRAPYPVDEPPNPRGPGSEPDYFPGSPAGGDLPKLESDIARGIVLTVSACVCAALGCASAVR